MPKMNEEHGYVKLNGTSIPHPIGERLHVIPNHVCPVIDLKDSFVATRSGTVIGTWPVDARGRSG